jgi:hypothetical protein
MTAWTCSHCGEHDTCARCDDLAESRAHAEYDRRVSEQEMNERADHEAHWDGAA